MKRIIWRSIFLAGILVLLGTVGANDMGTITSERFLLQAVIGSIMAATGLYKGELIA